MKKLTALATSASFLAFSAASAFATPTPFPTDKNDVYIAAPAQALSGGFSPNTVVAFIINMLFAIGIIASVVFLIWGGVKWVISGGDKHKVEEARNHIVAAIVGLVIVVASFVILSLVFSILGINWNPLGGQICIPTLQRATDCSVTPTPK